jgi:hypothetical protein
MQFVTTFFGYPSFAFFYLTCSGFIGGFFGEGLCCRLSHVVVAFGLPAASYSPVQQIHLHGRNDFG